MQQNELNGVTDLENHLDKLIAFQEVIRKETNPSRIGEFFFGVIKLINERTKPTTMMAIFDFFKRFHYYFDFIELPDSFLPVLTSYLSLNNKTTKAIIIKMISLFKKQIKPEFMVFSQLIGFLKSSDSEIYNAAIYTAQIMMKYSSFFSSSVLANMKYPQIIGLLPYAFNDYENISLVSKIFVENINFSDEHGEKLFYSFMECVKNVQYFPISCFDVLLSSMNNNLSDEHIVNLITQMIFEAKNWLIPQQIKRLIDVSRSLINTEHIKLSLVLVKELSIVDESYLNIQTDSAFLAFLILLLIPLELLTNDIIFGIFNAHLHNVNTFEEFNMVCEAINKICTKMDDDSHVYFVEEFLLNSLSNSKQNQDCFSQCLQYVPVEFSDFYLLIASRIVLLSDSLKIELISMMIRANKTINSQLLSINPEIIGNIAFRENRFDLACDFFSKTPNNSFAQALFFFSKGELNMINKKYSEAIEFYKSAEGFFNTMGPNFFMHITACKLRASTCSIYLQMQLLLSMPPIDAFDIYIDGLSSILSIADSFKYSTPLFSSSMPQNFSKGAELVVSHIHNFVNSIKEKSSFIMEYKEIFCPIPSAILREFQGFTVNDFQVLSEPVTHNDLDDIRHSVLIIGCIQNLIERCTSVLVDIKPFLSECGTIQIQQIPIRGGFMQSLSYNYKKQPENHNRIPILITFYAIIERVEKFVVSQYNMYL